MLCNAFGSQDLYSHCHNILPNTTNPSDCWVCYRYKRDVYLPLHRTHSLGKVHWRTLLRCQLDHHNNRYRLSLRKIHQSVDLLILQSSSDLSYCKQHHFPPQDIAALRNTRQVGACRCRHCSHNLVQCDRWALLNSIHRWLDNNPLLSRRNIPFLLL
jgi:hypothetical protein